MPNWYRMAGWRREIALDYRRAVETWICTDLTTPYVNTVSAIEDSVPRAIGSSHPDSRLAGAICRSKELIYGPVNGCAKVLVTFDSRSRGQTLYASRTSVTPLPDRIDVVPIITQAPTLSTGWAIASDPALLPTIERARICRKFTKTIAGDPDALTVQIMAQWGRGYIFGENYFISGWLLPGDPTPPGIPYIFKRFSVEPLPSGSNLVRYEFETFGPTPAIPALTYPGQDIAIPALNYLEQWGAPYFSASGTPTIPVLGPGAMAQPGGLLP